MMSYTRYIDPTTDFGFKRLFGQEESKDILKGFLFDVLHLPAPIADLNYISNEQLPVSEEERWGIYDVYCIDTEGRRFIVEMQRNRQIGFKECLVYYVTFPITQQAEKGKRFVQLLPIYCVSVLNFRLDEEPEYLRRIQLANIANGKVFYDKLTFVIIELPKFDQPLTPEMSREDRWIYLLQHMPALSDVPVELTDEPFIQAFDIARAAALTPDERVVYEQNLKRMRDEHGVLTTAHIEGLEEGLEQGIKQGREEGRREERLQIARAMRASGIDLATIAQTTGLSEQEITEL